MVRMIAVAECKPAKQSGRGVNIFDETTWTRVACSVAFHEINQKFKQCPRLLPRLLDTNDKKWGIELQKGRALVSPNRRQGSNALARSDGNEGLGRTCSGSAWLSVSGTLRRRGGSAWLSASGTLRRRGCTCLSIHPLASQSHAMLLPFVNQLPPLLHEHRTSPSMFQAMVHMPLVLPEVSNKEMACDTADCPRAIKHSDRPPKIFFQLLHRNTKHR